MFSSTYSTWSKIPNRFLWGSCNSQPMDHLVGLCWKHPPNWDLKIYKLPTCLTTYLTRTPQSPPQVSATHGLTLGGWGNLQKKSRSMYVIKPIVCNYHSPIKKARLFGHVQFPRVANTHTTTCTLPHVANVHTHACTLQLY